MNPLQYWCVRVEAPRRRETHLAALVIVNVVFAECPLLRREVVVVSDQYVVRVQVPDNVVDLGGKREGA
jgi:hypothetical protein